jgi:hypothetical protein
MLILLLNTRGIPNQRWILQGWAYLINKLGGSKGKLYLLILRYIQQYPQLLVGTLAECHPIIGWVNTPTLEGGSAYDRTKNGTTTAINMCNILTMKPILTQMFMCDKNKPLKLKWNKRRRILLTFWGRLHKTTSQSELKVSSKWEDNFVQSHPMCTFEELVQAFSRQDHKVQMDEHIYMSLWTPKQGQIEWAKK